MDIDIILDSIEQDEEDLLDTLDQLVHKQIWSAPSVTILSMRSKEKIGTVVYEDLDKDKRLHLHKVIAGQETQGHIGVSSALQIGSTIVFNMQAKLQLIFGHSDSAWERGRQQSVWIKSEPHHFCAKQPTSVTMNAHKAWLLSVQAQSQNKGE